MVKSYWRGHRVIWVEGTPPEEGMWVYEDTKEPTAGNDRNCGHCGKENTKEGYDGCLGALPGVKNACCGHDVRGEAYIVFDSGLTVRNFIIER